MQTPTTPPEQQNSQTPARRKRRPKPLSSTQQVNLADYVTTEDIEEAVEVLRRQLKRKNAKTARYLLEKALF
ncbi:MAG: hypothetical protein L0Y80_03710 [Ignavibacteriae bacterium]|nr:hypothetical protein [Ignavibacteriota bacterium]